MENVFLLQVIGQNPCFICRLELQLKAGWLQWPTGNCSFCMFFRHTSNKLLVGVHYDLIDCLDIQDLN